jgi:hypothetical protein
MLHAPKSKNSDLDAQYVEFWNVFVIYINRRI